MKLETAICLTVRGASDDEGGRISAVRGTLLLMLLIISGYFTSLQFLPQAHGQSGSTSVLYVSPISSSSSSSFSLNVNLNLSSTDVVSGYEIYLSYNDTILDATGAQLGNLFPPGSTSNSSYCINGQGYNCLGCCDSNNIVHISVAYFGGWVSGPSTSTVFSVQFSVRGVGHSFFQLFNGTTGPPQVFGAVGVSGLPDEDSILIWNGVYSNDGLQAFFNVAPDILLPNNPVFFDASATFNPENSSAVYRSGLNYTWDFGDGGKGNGVMVSHTFNSAKSYAVSLLVIDGSGNSSIITRVVPIVPALGTLVIGVIHGTNGNATFTQSVILALYNGSSLVETITRKPMSRDPFTISGLTPGPYRLDFSGSGITPASKQETAVAGKTTTDIVYLDVHTPPPPPSSSPDPWLFIIVGIIAAIFILGTVDLLRDRSKKRRRRR